MAEGEGSLVIEALRELNSPMSRWAFGMTASESELRPGLNRINGLLAWWDAAHLIGVSGMEAQAKRLRTVVALNELFNEAGSRQAQALRTVNEQFARVLQELLNVRQPPELMSAQSNLVAVLMESLATQATIWAELSHKLCTYCASMGQAADIEASTRADDKQAEAKLPMTEAGKQTARRK
jgi:hypothetical protein